MAEKLVSPGVFTKENDLSFLPQGISAIGAAIIGPTLKGPAFVPTLVTSPDDFIQKFGDNYEGSYVSYTIREYLKNAGRATVVRVADLEGYKSDALGITVGGSVSTLTPVIWVSTGSALLTPLAGVTVTGFDKVSTDFLISSGTLFSYKVSLNQNSSSYIGTVLGSTAAGNGTAVAAGTASYLFVSASDTTSLTNMLAFSTVGPTFAVTSRSLSALAVASGMLPLALLAKGDIDATLKTWAVLAPSTSSYAGTLNWVVSSANSTTLAFGLSSSLTGASSEPSYSLSFNTAASNYITNVLGTVPGDRKFYVYQNYLNRQNDLKNALLVAVTSSIAITSSFFLNSVTNTGIIDNGGYSEAHTPWVRSQVINSQKYNLFKFWTFSAGIPDVKISISDIKRPDEIPGFVSGSTYGSFTVTVRAIGDTDIHPNALESFSNVTLDPVSPNYIARVIGDQYRVYGTDADGNQKIFIYGDFANNSKYVRVEMGQVVPYNALPMGVYPYVFPVSNGVTSVFPNVKYITSQVTSLGDFNFRQYLGFDFDYITDNNFVSLPLPTGSLAQVLDTLEFSLENCKMSDATQTNEIAFNINNDNANAKKARKFTIALQGGFDGFDPTIGKFMGEDMVSSNIMGFDMTTAASSGVNAYKKAIDTVANSDEFDINMVVLPGITMDLAGSVITYANAMVLDRQDAFFLFDCVTLGGKGADRTTVTNAINSVKGLDSNYAATYFPWVKIYDQPNDKYVWVPPSVVMAGVISFNDRVSAEWWAPAGLNRGGISSAIQVASRLTQAERDALYENRVNPIAAFTGQGIVAWGQKTLQVKASALDRINVRRLLIAVKKFIASATKYLVFEQNTVATRTRFLNIVNPYLQSVQQKQGLYAFKVVMDETNNTPDVIDRNMMIGAIYLQPTRTAEIIQIDFNILPTGATFAQ